MTNAELLTFWQELVWTIGPPLVLALAGLILQELRKHGYRSALADALVRAAGEANNAAQAQGTTLANPIGRAAGIKAAVNYLHNTVPGSVQFFDLDNAALERRADAQIGAMIAPPVLALPSPTAVGNLGPGVSTSPAETYTYTPGSGMLPSGGTVKVTGGGPAAPTPPAPLTPPSLP